MAPEGELDILSGRRDTLDNSVLSLRWWLLGFILVVVIGLFVELWVIVMIFGTTHDPLQLAEAIGTGVVTLGVAGELGVEFRVQIKEVRLRRINEKIEVHYKNTLVEANQKISELREQLTPRTLSDSQQAAIAEKLTAFGGQKYAITSQWQSNEGRSFSAVLLHTLMRSRWQYTNVIRADFPHVLSGLGVMVHAGCTEETRKAAQGLVAALLAENVQVEGPYGVLGAEGDMVILDMGVKP